MNQHQTIMEASSFLQMMDTCTFLLEMVECPEIHLGNMGMLRISKNRQIVVISKCLFIFAIKV